jgi:hypothetical protein
VAALADVALSEAELADAAGISKEQLAGLHDFGVLARRDGEGYDGDDLVAARAAAGLFNYGIEPRHLRMFRQSADREAAFLAQIVAPVTKKRDPQARKEASESAGRLLGLSRQLRDALVRSRMKELL